MGVLEGKVILITGGGSGLGRETARLFVKEGAKVVICGRRAEKIKAVEQELNQPEHVLALAADVSREEDVQSLVQATYERFGRIDALINNAAVFESYYVADTSLDSWNYQWTNNVTSVFLMTKACLPLMRKQKSGKIISLTSSLAISGAAGFGPYGASKAAIEVLTSTVDEEESANGIVAHSFEPGVMKSNLQGSGVDPSAIAPYLLTLVLADKQYAGKVVTVDQLRKQPIQTN